MKMQLQFKYLATTYFLILSSVFSIYYSSHLQHVSKTNKNPANDKQK